MIEIITGYICRSAPIIRFSKRGGGYLNAYGGGKTEYEKGIHYAVQVKNKHPYNIVTEETIE